MNIALGIFIVMIVIVAIGICLAFCGE